MAVVDTFLQLVMKHICMSLTPCQLGTTKTDIAEYVLGLQTDLTFLRDGEDRAA